MFLQKPMLGTQIDRSDSLNNPVLDLLMNEGHGDRANDLSGHGNHGTLHGFDFPPTRTSGWNPGADGIGLNFDGVDDYIDCGNNPSLTPTDAFTIEALVKAKNNGSIYTGIANKEWAGGSGDQKGFGLNWNSGALFKVADDTSNFKEVSSALTNNEWHFLTAVKDTSKLYLYVDRVLKDENDITGYTDYNHAMHIGKYCAFGSYWFKGAIARARILPHVMSAFEVMQTQINPYGVYLR